MDHRIVTLKNVLIYMTRNRVPPGFAVGPGGDAAYEARHILPSRPKSKRKGASHQPGCAADSDP
jgi:hypothetical protein